MDNIHAAINIWLDALPFLWMLFYPFRKQLRTSFAATLGIAYGIMVAYGFGILWILQLDSYSFTLLRVYTFGQFFLFLVLARLLIRGSLGKILFVLGFMLPLSTTVTALASYAMPLISWPDAPKYLCFNLTRLFWYGVLAWPAWEFWKRKCVPSLDMRDDAVWKYAWLIPTSTNVITLLAMDHEYSVVPISTQELLFLLCIVLCNVAAWYVVFSIIGIAEERARLSERDKQNRILLDLEMRQSGMLRESVEHTRELSEACKKEFATIVSMLDVGRYEDARMRADRYAHELPKTAAEKATASNPHVETVDDAPAAP